MKQRLIEEVMQRNGLSYDEAVIAVNQAENDIFSYEDPYDSYFGIPLDDMNELCGSYTCR